MATLSAELVERVSGEVAWYIAEQRDRFFSRAEPMTVGAKTALQGFFRAEGLESTRFLVLDGERIENPEFYVTLRGIGVCEFAGNSDGEVNSPLQTARKMAR